MLTIFELHPPSQPGSHRCMRHLSTCTPTSRSTTYHPTPFRGRSLNRSRRRGKITTEHAPRGLFPKHTPNSKQLLVEQRRIHIPHSHPSSSSSNEYSKSSSRSATPRSRRGPSCPVTRKVLTHPSIASISQVTRIYPRPQRGRRTLLGTALTTSTLVS